MKRWLIGLGVLLVVLVGGLAAAVMTLNSTDWSAYEEPIAQAVEEATGRKLKLGGELSVHIGLSPAVFARAITFQNAEWGSRPQLALLDKVGIRLKLMPLMFGSIEISRVEISGLDVLLETDAEGKGNWEFGDDSTEAASTLDEPTADEPGLQISAFLQTAVIENVNLAYKNGVTGETHHVRISSLRANMASPDAPLHLTLDAQYQENQIGLEGSISGIAQALSGGPLGLEVAIAALGAEIDIAGNIDKPLERKGIDVTVSAKGDSLSRLAEFAGSPVTELGAFDVGVHITGDAELFGLSDLSASLNAAGASLKATGAVADPLNVKGIDISFRAKGQSLAALSRLAATELPDMGSFDVAASVTGGDNKFDISKLSVKLGDTEILGKVTADIGEKPMLVNAVLSSPVVDLIKLGLAEESPAESKGEPGQEGGSENKRVLPDDPLPLDDLKALDAVKGRIVLKVGKMIVDSGTTISDLDVGLDLAPRKLKVNPLKAAYMNAVVDGRLELDTSKKPAAVVVNMAIAHPELGKLMEAQDSDMLTGGPVDIDIDIAGRGNSVADIMASLNGKFVIRMGAAQIHDEWAQRAMTSVVTVMAKRGKTEPVDLNCVTADFEINDGIAVPASLVVNTPTLSLFGTGQIDLRDETINLQFDRLATGVSAAGALPPFKMAGTLASPSGGVDAGALGSKIVGFGASLVTRSENRTEVTASSGPERCQQMLVAYNEIMEDRAHSKDKAAATAGKATSATKEATKSAFGKVRGLFWKKKNDQKDEENATED